MTSQQGPTRPRQIRIAIAGVGNCTSALLEGISYYSANDTEEGLLFPDLCGYSVTDIDVVVAFDISARKVGLPLGEAIYQAPNNFVRLGNVRADSTVEVQRGPTYDGNPEHLALIVPESPAPTVDVAAVLRERRADLLVNLLPTGSILATEFYAKAALEARCGFINCIPTPLAQRTEIERQFSALGLPLLGDDVKSQMGTTILHRALLGLLDLRGSRLRKTSQVNIGGNTDFANFLYRAETKLVSKRKSLAQFLGAAESHIGHHYDPTRGPLKTAFIEIETKVFAGSPVRIAVRLESDDKPNCAGSLVDLIRLAKGALDSGVSGCVPEACAFYMKSPPVQMDDAEALRQIRDRWGQPGNREVRHARAMDTNLG